MHLSIEDYRAKVLGCWLGKNIGGTLGDPFEWKRQLNDVSFYTQELGGQPRPNDDLDIQLLWLIALEDRGLDLDAHILAEYWCLFVTPHWAEYGTAKINMRAGLHPPLSGNFGNEYRHSCGAYIRAEIWACIAPGLPAVAAAYALQDAMLDHGDGEGTYAEVFIAALESAAFVLSDIRALIEIGLSYIPPDCGVAGAIRTAIECCDKGLSWQDARDEILRRHRGAVPHWVSASARDVEMGLADGPVGYDAPGNVALTILPLLLSEDFGDIVCTAVNCGEDTDCTAATAASIFGLMHGAAAIPARWIAPIGRTIVTGCLNLGELGHYGDRLPPTVDNLTERTEHIARQLLLRHGQDGFSVQPNGSPVHPNESSVHPNESSVQPNESSVQSNESPVQSSGSSVHANESSTRITESLLAPASWNTRAPSGPRFEFQTFVVEVNYGDAPTIRAGQPKTVRVSIWNKGVQANLSLEWLAPAGWSIAPAPRGFALSIGYVGPTVIEFAVTLENPAASVNRAALQITLEGRPTTLLVPITLLNGTLMGGA